MPESKKSPYQTGGMPVKFSEMRDGLTGFAAYLALPAMLPMRRGLGLRKLSLGGLFSMAFLMYLADSLSGTHVSLMGGVQTSSAGLLTYYQRQLEDDLNTSDSLLEAKLHASLVEHLDKQQAPEVRSMRETGGIATGADAGLSEQIARRRKEAAAANHHTSVNNTGVYE